MIKGSGSTFDPTSTSNALLNQNYNGAAVEYAGIATTLIFMCNFGSILYHHTSSFVISKAGVDHDTDLSSTAAKVQKDPACFAATIPPLDATSRVAAVTRVESRKLPLYDAFLGKRSRSVHFPRTLLVGGVPRGVRATTAATAGISTDTGAITL